MTICETIGRTSTLSESDGDWATETLGASATISGGSDCFTANTVESTNYAGSGSGPESSTDTSDPLTGTVSVNPSGSSWSSLSQTFGDVLGSGGTISSGSLTYSNVASQSDADTRAESGTETFPDGAFPSQTASYSIGTNDADTHTDDESGSETLGVEARFPREHRRHALGDGPAWWDRAGERQ